MPGTFSVPALSLVEEAAKRARGDCDPAQLSFFVENDISPEHQNLTYAVCTTEHGTECLGPVCDSEVRKAVKGDPREVQFFEDPLLVTGRNSKKTVLAGDPLWEDKGGYVIYRPSQPHNAIVHQEPHWRKRPIFVQAKPFPESVDQKGMTDTAQKISLVKDNGELAWGASKLKRYLKNLAVADQSGKVIGFASEPQCLEKAMYDPTSFRLLHDPMIATGPNKEEMWLATNDIRVKSLTEKWSCVKFFKPSERESSQKWLKDQKTSGSVRYSKSAKSVAENFSRGEDIKYDVQPQRVEFAEDPTAILKRYPTDDKKEEDSENKLNRHGLPHRSFITNGGETFTKLATYLQLQQKENERTYEEASRADEGKGFAKHLEAYNHAAAGSTSQRTIRAARPSLGELTLEGAAANSVRAGRDVLVKSTMKWGELAHEERWAPAVRYIAGTKQQETVSPGRLDADALCPSLLGGERESRPLPTRQSAVWGVGGSWVQKSRQISRGQGRQPTAPHGRQLKARPVKMQAKKRFHPYPRSGWSGWGPERYMKS